MGVIIDCGDAEKDKAKKKSWQISLHISLFVSSADLAGHLNSLVYWTAPFFDPRRLLAEPRPNDYQHSTWTKQTVMTTAII